jgi:hypothetical protein
MCMLYVACIQMAKALMPCVVYQVGMSLKVETFQARTMVNMVTNRQRVHLSQRI